MAGALEEADALAQCGQAALQEGGLGGGGGFNRDAEIS